MTCTLRTCAYRVRRLHRCGWEQSVRFQAHARCCSSQASFPRWRTGAGAALVAGACNAGLAAALAGHGGAHAQGVPGRRERVQDLEVRRLAHRRPKDGEARHHADAGPWWICDRPSSGLATRMQVPAKHRPLMEHEALQSAAHTHHLRPLGCDEPGLAGVELAHGVRGVSKVDGVDWLGDAEGGLGREGETKDPRGASLVAERRQGKGSKAVKIDLLPSGCRPRSCSSFRTLFVLLLCISFGVRVGAVDFAARQQNVTSSTCPSSPMVIAPGPDLRTGVISLTRGSSQFRESCET